MRKPDPARLAFRPSFRLPALGPAVALAAALALAGCATPREAPPGPGIDPGAAAPALSDQAFWTADGLALPVRCWAPPKGTAPRGVVLALHGFNDYSGAFRETGPKLAAGGLLVYAYDQRGFGGAPNKGLWPGKAALKADAVAMARLLKLRHPGLPLYLLGLSMGGAVAMTALADHPDLATGAVLVAPAVRGRGAIPRWQLWALDAAVATIPWYPATGQGLQIQPTDNIALLRRMSLDPNVIKETRLDAIYGLVDLMTTAAASAPRQQTPLLFLYGLKDDLVPMAPTVAALDALPPPAPGRPPPRVAVYPEGRHMLLRDLEGDRAIADILAWIADPAAPLPSGADRGARARLEAAAAR